MLLIRAVSFKGQPIGRELAARFTESGGTIGRGENSVLILPDPDRYISRTHAIISFQAGGFVITDNGTKNPIILNGRPMGPGSQQRLNDGDEIKLGGYTLEVTFASARSSQAPVGEIGEGRGSGTRESDPFAPSAGPTPSASDPFADLMRPAVPAAPRPVSGNWPGAEPVSPPAPQRLPPDPLLDLQGREPKVDELLGLTPSAIADPLGPREPLGPPFLESERSRAVDPLEVLGGVAKPIPPPTAAPDHVQEVFTHYSPPAARLDPALEMRPEPPAPTLPARDPLPSVEPPMVQSPRPVVSSPVEASFLQVFLEGAGIPGAHLPNGLTPELMRLIGALLREAVQGTLDLLRVRGLTKSEMRADITMIMPMDNNPLKFSPTAEAALLQLLAPSGHGFTPPVPAMKNAYEDLRAHQLGFLAGMRAALEEVLARFSPEELQKRLADPSVVDSLLPMNRKAKRWDLFVERYQEVAGEAREDFNAAFGKAFRRAYEAQVKQLRDAGRR